MTFRFCYFVISVAFSPDGQSILSGSDDKTIKLWDKGSGKMLKSFEGHSNSVMSVAFSPDGQSILSGSCDKTIKLWDKGSGKMLKSFNSIAFDFSFQLPPELKLFFSNFSQFRCVFTIKTMETPLYCKDMILYNIKAEQLNSSNKKVFLQRGAIELQY